jgi:hypothetical protein
MYSLPKLSNSILNSILDRSPLPDRTGSEGEQPAPPEPLITVDAEAYHFLIADYNRALETVDRQRAWLAVWALVAFVGWFALYGYYPRH